MFGESVCLYESITLITTLLILLITDDYVVSVSLVSVSLSDDWRLAVADAKIENSVWEKRRNSKLISTVTVTSLLPILNRSADGLASATAALSPLQLNVFVVAICCSLHLFESNSRENLILNYYYLNQIVMSKNGDNTSSGHLDGIKIYNHIAQNLARSN